VWFEDARSARAKLNLPFQYNLAGVSYWLVNWYFPQKWLVLNGLYDVAKHVR
jgi:spore germination protein